MASIYRNLIKWGVGLLGLLLLFLLGYMYYSNKRINTEIINIDSVNRESNIEYCGNPINIVENQLYALLEDDMDKFIRGSALREKSTNVYLIDLLLQGNTFSFDKYYAPSGTYKTYVPISEKQLLAEYALFYTQLKANLPDDFIIESVDYVMPKQQTSENYNNIRGEQCYLWKLEDITEVMAIIKAENQQEYVIGFTLGLKNGQWKMTDCKSSLLGLNEVEVRAITWDEYCTFVGSEQEKIELEIKLDVYRCAENISSMRNYLLPLNYHVLNRTVGKKPEDIISSFYKFIKNGNLESAMECFSVYEQEKTQYEELSMIDIENMCRIANDLKYFYYHLYTRDLPEEETSFVEYRQSPRQIVDYMTPEYMNYLRLVDIQQYCENADGSREYIILLKYAKEHVLTGMTLEPVEGGWQIRELSAKNAGYGKGEVR